MPVEYRFTCPLPNGIHARLASAIEEVTRPLAPDVTLRNERTGHSANAKSVLGIVGLDIRFDDPVRVEVDGPGEHDAMAVVRTFVETRFPGCDEPLATPADTGGEVRLPPVLAATDPEVRAGTAVVPGIGVGRLVRCGGFAVPAAIPTDGAGDPDAEAGRIHEALARLLDDFDRRIEQAGTASEAGVLAAHRAIARDPEFRDRLHEAIRDRQRTAAGAIADAEAFFTSMLHSSGSALLRERVLDIQDVAVGLLRQAYGDAWRDDGPSLADDSVCAAETLTPGQLLALERRYVKGLVLAHAGTTSHTVVLARSFAVPTLVGVEGAADPTLAGRMAVVDGELGLLVTAITGPVARYYELERRRLDGRRRRLRAFADRPATTEDGRTVDIGANIGSAGEVTPALAAGADGIGLFRTEMLFVARGVPPTEDEQFGQYRRAIEDARGRPVIVRTLDAGGDKPIPYLKLPREDNPFLGFRGVRLYQAYEAIFRTQVRALARASAYGPLRVMVPMIASVDEARWVRQIAAEEQARLAEAGQPVDRPMHIGAMVEVPSAAFLADHLGRELDFVSIGTNDLLQYFVAADRGNPRVTGLYDPLAPSFLRLLKKTIDDFHAQGRSVGVCGEMGGEPRCLPLLVGLGADEISMAAPGIAAAKAAMARLSSSACRALVDEAVGCATAADVRRALDRFGSGARLPLIDPDLVMTGCDARTKAEAIKQAVDRLFVAGRADRPREIEEAVWRREEVCGTGIGHGFAIPHCKTDAVAANSLVILKLDRAVDWGAIDGEPVSVLLLLAIRESDQASEHMRVLAALARRLMHEEFRHRLATEAGATALCRFIAGELGA